MTEDPQKFNKLTCPNPLNRNGEARRRLFGCNWLAFVYDTRPNRDT